MENQLLVYEIETKDMNIGVYSIPGVDIRKIDRAKFVYVTDGEKAKCVKLKRRNIGDIVGLKLNGTYPLFQMKTLIEQYEIEEKKFLKKVEQSADFNKERLI